MKPADQKSAPVLFTYTQAEGIFFARIDKESGNRTARYRFTGPLKGYRAYHNALDDDLIAEVTRDILDRRIDEYVASIKGADSTRYNHASALRYWGYSFLLPLVASSHDDQLPRELADAIAQAMREEYITAKDLAIAAGVPQHNINGWTALRKQPREAFRRQVEAIENALNRPPGTFTSRCTRFKSLADHTTEKIRLQTAKHVAQQKNTYFLRRRDWPVRVEQEWDHLVQVAAGTLLPFPGYLSNAFWTTKETKAGQKKVPTSGLTELCFAAFFGFCLKAGVEREHLTIALVKEVPLVLRFFEFLRLRNGLNFLDKEEILGATDHYSGHYTTTVDNWAKMMFALLEPKRGYLWQISSYRKALTSTAMADTYLPFPNAIHAPVGRLVVAADGSVAVPRREISSEELPWQRECEESYTELARWLAGKRKRKQIRRGTTLSDRVEWITDLDRPLDPLVKATKDMRNALPPRSDKSLLTEKQYRYRMQKRALRFQDMLMLEFNMALPLRPENIREMTFRGKSPNLFKHKGSSRWGAKFKEWEKKNYKECDIALPLSLSADIDEFIEVHRPFLPGAHTDYVFRPSSLGNQPRDPAKKADAPITESWYTQRWYDFTERFIGKPRFPPYAMRHIVTTAWLKENPDGLLVAAAILDDEVQRVIDHYAHLRKQDLYRHYERHYEATVERVLTGAVAHEPLQQIPACYLDTIVTAIENARNRGQSLEEVEIAMKAILRSVKARQAMRQPQPKAT